MASAIINSVRQKLELLEWTDFTLHDEYRRGSDYVTLGLLRTFVLCGTICRSHLSVESSASFSSIEQAIQEEAQRFLHNLSLITGQRSFTVYDFSRQIDRFKEEIDGLYADILECMSSSVSSLLVGEFMEFFESLPQNLRDIQNLDYFYRRVHREIFQTLEEDLIFFKKFICFAVSQGLEQKQLENFLIHCQVVGVKVGRMSLSYTSFMSDDKPLYEDISELVNQIKPVHPQVGETYIQVLKAINLSGSPLILSTAVEKEILGDFVDYLLANLWEVLLVDGTSFMQSGKYQLQMLYEGLQFLRNILTKQQEKFNALQVHTKDLIGAVITDAGILIFSAYMHHKEEASEEEMIQVLCSLLDKNEGIKAEVPETHLVKSTFNFPTAKDLEFIDHLLENLKELASCKIDSLSSVKAVVQRVQEDLLFLRTSLQNIVEQRNQHEKFQAFLSHVMEVAYEAEFVIDSLMIKDISPSLVKLFNNIAEQIKLVKTESLEIGGHKYVFVAQKTGKTLSLVPLQKTVSTINEDVVGLNDQATAIIDQLTRGPKQLDVVSIFGMPGLGKTTLAQKVYHDAAISHHFHILAWCCISQVYCRKDLLIEILVCIFPHNSNKYSGMKEDDLEQELRRRLKRNRYLIVLDDVWDIKAWNALEICFPKDDNGSRILLTSRHSDVALQIKPPGKLYPLRRLTDAESFELFQKKLAGKDDYYPALPVLGKKIARNCRGLPLTVVVIAGILSTLDPVGWEEVVERLSSAACGTDDCMNVLELSYEYLPTSLKPCLLYFGAFVEDEEISIQRLMRLWIAEGFVEKNGEKSPEEMAERYIMTLISKSLIMVDKRSSTGGVKTCRIHDLLHEFCAAKAKNENFVQLVRGADELSNFDVPHKLRRLCIKTPKKQFAKARLFGPRIRSLLFIDEDRYFHIGSSALFLALGLERLELLRVLDLEQFSLGCFFPDEITMLIHLRYLAVQGMFEDIPPLIANLSNLETFVLRLFNDPILLPDTIWMLQKLRCLRVLESGVVNLTFPIEDLESPVALLNLDTLSILDLELGQNMVEVLRKFPNIRKLKCRLSNNSTGERKEMAVDMGFLSRLRSLGLTLRNVHFAQTEFHFPSHLVKLTLRGTLSSSILATIGKLMSLEVLKVNGHGRAKGLEMWEMEEGDFPQLKFLKLRRVNIEGWTGSGDHLPCLEKLILSKCEKLRELPSCLGCMSTLESIKVYDCPASVVNLVRDIKEELLTRGNDLEVIIQEQEEAEGGEEDEDEEEEEGNEDAEKEEGKEDEDEADEEEEGEDKADEEEGDEEEEEEEGEEDEEEADQEKGEDKAEEAEGDEDEEEEDEEEVDEEEEGEDNAEEEEGDEDEEEEEGEEDEEIH